MKEACKFAEWISWYGYEQDVDTGKWIYWDDRHLSTADTYTTEELYEIFKQYETEYDNTINNKLNN